ncbi:MAG: hypothetical protein IPP98_15235 [Gemmatimonadetes bacterium]|nr:hypothetical protein [Gemmatimonadota bacterium]
MLQHVMSITLIATVASASPAPSQIRANTSIGGRTAAPPPRIMVANPALATSTDSAASVAIGDGMRDKITKSVTGTFTVLTKRDMNTALAAYGFAENEVLNATSAMRLANQIDARTVVTSTLSKGADGRFSLIVRVSGSSASLDVGHVVTIAQAPGQPLADFGSKAGEAIVPALKGWNDAKACLDQSTTKLDKANEAAQKAFRAQPGHGLASYCLAEIASKRDSAGAATMQAWQDVTKADQYSLTAWQHIASIHANKGDSAKVVETYQQMLRVAPTNQLLRDQSYKVFQGYGRPDAAMQVVDEGIKMDPANTDWYDLKSNVCIGKGDLGCAVASLEELFSIDSTKADTNFYAKILYAAKEKPDTAKYLMWAKRGAAKYDSRADILEELAIAYGWTGQSDSSVATARKMIMVDDTKTDALMRVVKSLLDGKKYREATSLASTVNGLSDVETKNTYGAMLVRSADEVRSATPPDNALLIQMSDAILSSGTTNNQVIVLANFFISAALAGDVQEMSKTVRTPQATCESTKTYEAVLAKIEPALVSAATSPTAQIADFAKRFLPSVQSEKVEVVKMLAQRCK